MKRVKKCTRSKTSDNRISHQMILHDHKEELDNIDMVEVANDFVSKSPDKKVKHIQRNPDRYPAVLIETKSNEKLAP